MTHQLMASRRVLPAALALALTLAACQSSEQSAEQAATNDQIKVAQRVEAVCAARVDVDAALNEVGALTPESTVGDAEQAGEKLRQALAKLDGAEGELGKAEVKEYRDQVAIFQAEVERVRKDKSLTLKQASQQLQNKVAPVVAARSQLDAVTVCVEIDAPSTGPRPADDANANQPSDDQTDAAAEGEAKGDS
ncbi:hypothetical protein [Synechococcus sp. UW140]|uniref:hypothetical protein n=1 Tax=Synechococcus sp. UW140 TaxID=368503 RepID=UPI001FCB496A|nr:hypothetical protein [Synechococcus sp. UW140]